MDQLTAMGYRGTVSLLDRSYKTLSWKEADFHLDIKVKKCKIVILWPRYFYRTAFLPKAGVFTLEEAKMIQQPVKMN